jgi:FR47-like protein
MSDTGMKAIDADLARCIESNYINEYRPMHDFMGATFNEDDLVTEFTTDLPTTWLNGILCADGRSASLPQRMEEIISERRNRGPFSWRLGVLTPNRDVVRKLLQTHAPKRISRTAGMILNDPSIIESTTMTARPKDQSLIISEVRSEKELAQFMIPFNQSFCPSEITADFVEKFFRTRLEQYPKETFLTGYLGERPVSCSYYVVNSDVAMINGVSTIEEFRGRGFARRIAEATIVHINTAHKLPVSAYTSEMSISLCKKMGFTDVYVREDYVFE